MSEGNGQNNPEQAGQNPQGGTASPNPVVLVTITQQPDGSVSFSSALHVHQVVFLLMQFVTQFTSQPKEEPRRVIASPTGLGFLRGFRPPKGHK